VKVPADAQDFATGVRTGTMMGRRLVPAPIHQKKVRPPALPAQVVLLSGMQVNLARTSGFRINLGGLTAARCEHTGRGRWSGNGDIEKKRTEGVSAETFFVAHEASKHRAPDGALLNSSAIWRTEPGHWNNASQGKYA